MIKKLSLLVTLFFAIISLNAQVCENLDAGEDVQMTCTDTDVELNATVLAPNYRTTRDYTVANDPLCPAVTYDGSRTFIAIDDQWSGFVIDMPFTFCFYENQYDQLLVSGNGIVTFDLTVMGAFSNWNTDPVDLLGTDGQQNWQTNAIFGVYHDMDSSVLPRDDRISYKTEGIAPNRKFIISFEALQFSCNDLLSKSQITLYESSNVIDIRVDEKPVCNGWNEGLAVAGIQNKSGTLSQTGREHGVWTPAVGGELWRFVPNGEDLDYTLTWYDANGTILNSDDGGATSNNSETVTVDPNVETTYVIELIMTDQCNDTTNTLFDTVTITPGFTPDLDFPVNLAECENPVGSGTFDFNIDQTTLILNGLDPADFIISYHSSQTDADNNTNPITVLNPYNSGDATIYIRVEDINDATCVTIRSFTLTIQFVEDTSFTYNPIIFCTDDANPLPTAVSAMGTYTISNGGVINATTGEIDLIASGLGTDNTGNFTITHAINNCSPETDFDITIEITFDAGFTYDSIACISSTNPVATITGDAGGTFTVDGGATINPTTGELDLTTTTVSTIYTVTYAFGGNCPSSTEQTIEVISDDATFFYNQNSPNEYCSDDTNPTPTSVTPGGVYTINNGGTINATTGGIDLVASGLGTDNTGNFVVTYTITACSVSTDVDILIELTNDASFVLPTTACLSDASNPIATSIVTVGGTFSIAPTGATIHPTTGEIDLASSTAGTYTVTYSFGGNCPSSTDQVIELITDDDSTIVYTPTQYCSDDTNPTPTITTAGGTFTINNGGAIDASTGEVDLITSGLGTDTSGNFTITYTTNGVCNTSTDFDIVIELTNDASFTYPASVCFTDSTNPTASGIVTTGGTFTIDDGSVTFNATTGEIDLSTTTIGATYQITYSFNLNGNCPSSTTQTVNIVADDDSSFTYPATQYCNDGTDPSPTAVTAGGTYTINNGGIIDATTGVIDLSASDLGNDNTGDFIITYITTGSCSTFSTFLITIELTNDASFVFPADVCFTDTTNPIPTSITTTGGIFTVNNGATIHATTGALDLSSTTVGSTYIITYSFGGNCPSDSQQTVTIGADDDSSFTYSPTQYCSDDTNPTPTATTFGGTYSINNGGTIDTTTGVIDLLTSGLGTDNTGNFTITYTTSGLCSTSTDFNITIILTNDAAFTYSTDICIAEANPVAVTVTSGGTFTVDNGATIDTTTGELDLTTTTEGTTYRVTYSFGGACPSSTFNDILINPSPTATAPTTVPTACNIGGGDANFDFVSDVEDEIIGSQTNVTVTYHTTQTDAENGVSSLPTSPFTVANGNVWARVENTAGCFAIVEITVEIEQCLLVIPEAISPNSPIVENHTFTIERIRTMFPDFEVFIFNRYGSEVFYGNASNNDWNGKIDNTGSELPVGTYFYGINLNDENKIRYRGWVYLQR